MNVCDVARNGGSKASGMSSNPAKIRAVERTAEALRLRKAGLSHQAIADRLGYSSAQRAHEAIVRAIKALPREDAYDVRRLESERLDRMFLGVWTRAKQGDAEAIAAAMRIMERRAKYLGLDAPAKVQTDNRTEYSLVWPDDDDRDPQATDPDASSPSGTSGGEAIEGEV